MRDGVPIVSDGEGGGVYRVNDGKSLERIDRGDFISPQTPSVSADGSSLFVPDYLRGIGILGLSTRQVLWLSMDNKFILNGIDGLYLHGDSVSPCRTVPPRARHLIPARPLPRQSHTRRMSSSPPQARLAIPPTVSDLGSDFYYIANSGWDTLDDNGERKATAKVTTARTSNASRSSSVIRI